MKFSRDRRRSTGHPYGAVPAYAARPRCHARYDDLVTTCPVDGVALEAPPDPMVGRTLASRYKILRRVGAGQWAVARMRAA